MTTINIRERLHQFTDTIEDKKVAAIYTLLEDEIEPDAQRKKLIMAERKRYLKGEGKSYAWEDIKAMAIDKTKRNEL